MTLWAKTQEYYWLYLLEFLLQWRVSNSIMSIHCVIQSRWHWWHSTGHYSHFPLVFHCRYVSYIASIQRLLSLIYENLEVKWPWSRPLSGGLSSKQGRLPMGGWETNVPRFQKWELCFTDQIWGGWLCNDMHHSLVQNDIFVCPIRCHPRRFWPEHMPKILFRPGSVGELTALPKTP